MLTSKISWRLPPSAFARYIAVSASRRMSSARVYPVELKATPMLADTNTSLALELERQGDRFLNARRNADGLGRVPELVQQNRELVASEPRNARRRDGRRLQAAS